MEARQHEAAAEVAVRPSRMRCVSFQVHTSVPRPQVPLLLLLRATNGTDRLFHSLLNLSSITATDLTLDLPLRREPTHP